MTVYVKPSTNASPTVVGVCETIEHILDGDCSDAMLDSLNKKLSTLIPNEKEQLKNSLIREIDNDLQVLTPGITPEKIIRPYPYPETEIGQINPLSLPFNNPGWAPLITALKKHNII